MSDNLSAAVIDLLIKSLWDGLKVQLSYLCCYSCNVKSLGNEVKALEEKQKGIEQNVTSARNNLDVVIPEVETWLSEATDVLEKSKTISDKAAQVKERCLPKRCPMLHYALSRDAKKTSERCIELKNRSNFQRISNPVNPGDIDPVPNTSEFNFSSRDSVEKEILEALEDESVYLIGLCGMGGVGKTTMARKIGEIVRERRKDSGSTFKYVVTTTISQNPDVLEIQEDIAEGLGLDLKQYESPNIRADLIHQRLKKENGVLIILDDVWKRLDLNELGISPQTTNCKLIITSRERHVLQDTKIFHLDVLSEEESMILFRKNAGDEVDSDELRPIANDVVKECKRLPLALVTVGRVLRGRRKSFWEEARQELQQSMPINIPDVLKNVYRPLMLSFNHLGSEEFKYVFLLCCLFPEDSLISQESLVRYGMGLGIFRSIENLEQARNRVETIIDCLVSSSLLIEIGDQNDNMRIKMHDVIRDMGIWMTSEEMIESEGKMTSKKLVFKISHGNKEWPIVKEGNNYTCISLIFSQRVVPNSINCPSLELLHVDCKTMLEDSFFSGMRELKVLEASKLLSMPSSIQVAKNLQTVHLFDCKLEKTSMAGLGELKKLEILCFRRCVLDVLPKEMRGLKRLRKLDIIDCRGLRTIAFGVISGLVRLEELIIKGSFKAWDAEENEDNSASLVELDSLSQLTVLHIEILSNVISKRRFPARMQRLKKYSIDVSVKSFTDYQFETKFMKSISLGGPEGTHFGDWVYNMARDADRLKLESSSCMAVVNRLCRSGYRNLKHFSLKTFTDVQCLSYASGDGQFMGAVFPILKILEIGDSSSLQEIINGSPPSGSFEALEKLTLTGLSGLVRFWAPPCEQTCLSNLKEIIISSCKSLPYLFPFSMVKTLSQLTKLAVSDCPVMEEIFKMEEGGMETTIKKLVFPKLRSLSLRSLESLHEFCRGADEIEVPALADLSIGEIPRIMEGGCSNIHQQFLFDKVQVAGNSLVLLRMMFSPRANFNFGTGLESLTIGSIRNFRSIISPSTLRFFPSLRNLDINNCLNLEEVIGRGEENLLFPQLGTLELRHLPNILTFCHCTDDLEFANLWSLEIEDCPVMETFDRGISGDHDSFFSGKVLCPNLSRLRLENLNIRRIFSHGSVDNFGGLRYLTVRSCHRIKSLFSPYILNNLKNLVELYLDDCEELQEVIGKEDEEEPTKIKLTLPHLKFIYLKRLPKLCTICHVSNHLELPSLESVTISGDCPLLDGLLGDNDYAAKFFFSKEVLCPKLRRLHLEKLNIRRIFSHGSVDNFGGLGWLTVISCHRIRSLFSPYILNNLKNLVELYLDDCEELQEVIGKEDEEEPTKIKLTLPHLKFIYLKRLPKLCTFCHVSNHLELPSLESVTISGDCPLLDGLLGNNDYAAKFFFNKEKSSHDIHLDNNRFIISARDLLINGDSSNCWSFERDSSDRCVASAKLENSGEPNEITGKFQTKNLSAGVVYEVIFILKLPHPFFWREPVDLKLAVSGEIMQHRRVILAEKVANEWFEVLVGEFIREAHQIGDLEFSLSVLDAHTGLSIKGARIQIKA